MQHCNYMYYTQLKVHTHHLGALRKVFGDAAEDGVSPVVSQLHNIRVTHFEPHGGTHSLQCRDEVL